MKHICCVILLLGFTLLCEGRADGQTATDAKSNLYLNARKMFDEIEFAFTLPKGQQRIDFMNNIIDEQWDIKIVSDLKRYLQESPTGVYRTEAKTLLDKAQKSERIRMIGQVRPMIGQVGRPTASQKRDSPTTSKVVKEIMFCQRRADDQGVEGICSGWTVTLRSSANDNIGSWTGGITESGAFRSDASFRQRRTDEIACDSVRFDERTGSIELRFPRTLDRGSGRLTGHIVDSKHDEAAYEADEFGCGCLRDPSRDTLIFATTSRLLTGTITFDNKEYATEQVSLPLSQELRYEKRPDGLLLKFSLPEGTVGRKSINVKGHSFLLEFNPVEYRNPGDPNQLKYFFRIEYDGIEYTQLSWDPRWPIDAASDEWKPSGHAEVFSLDPRTKRSFPFILKITCKGTHKKEESGFQYGFMDLEVLISTK